MMRLKDLEFNQFINKSKIQQKVRELAQQINEDYRDLNPVFVPVLNGAFIFAADLIKQIEIPCRVSFVKISSYVGTHTSGQAKSLIGLEESLFNQHVVIIEDIIDSGLTLGKLAEDLKSLGAKSVEIATLLRKQAARDNNFETKYVGFEIGNEFVVGYGLDYDGLGRNTPEIYKAKSES